MSFGSFFCNKIYLMLSVVTKKIVYQKFKQKNKFVYLVTYFIPICI